MSQYRRTLSHLLAGFCTPGSISDRAVTSLTADSREVKPGCLFVALKGSRFDARSQMEEAFERGAVAVLLDSEDMPAPDRIFLEREDVIVLAQLRLALSEIAGRFYDHPSHKMTVIGVTGTNGKTTVAYLLAQMFDRLEHTAAVIGTLGKGRINSIEATGMTTLDAIKTQECLATMWVSGVDLVAMEISSHGLDLGRVSAITFDYVILTNLSQDHLDFHQSMRRYAAAKMRLFKDYQYQKAIINHDDELGQVLIKELAEDVLDYGLGEGQLRADRIELTAQGIVFRLCFEDKGYCVQSALIGEFNVYNLLAVLATGLAMGHAMPELLAVIKQCEAVPGRMQRVQGAQDQPVVVVDYAHTPDALDKALAACRAHCVGTLTVVFGCGGDRDRAKRAVMGSIAENNADQVFITDDNPRCEQPGKIVNDIVEGMKFPAWVIHDRAQAIEIAISKSGGEDWVLVAGKGHEATQQYADYSIEVDDQSLAIDVLQRLAA